MNALSALLFVGAFVLVWGLRALRFPDFPRWTLGFPLIALFLITNKVYSPQYSLWLLPWFALALPGLRRFIAFEVADVAVFVTRFWWFGKYQTNPLASPGWFEAMVLLRTAVLLWCVCAWVWQRHEPLSIETMWAQRRAAAAPPPPEATAEVTPRVSADAVRSETGTQTPGRDVRLRDGLVYCFWVFLAVRVGLSLLSVVGSHLIPPLDPVQVTGWHVGPVTVGWHNLFTATERQDALWFLRIGTSGYAPHDGSAAFFPLYPMAIRVVAWLPGRGPAGGGAADLERRVLRRAGVAARPHAAGVLAMRRPAPACCSWPSSPRRSSSWRRTPRRRSCCCRWPRSGSPGATGGRPRPWPARWRRRRGASAS